MSHSDKAQEKREREEKQIEDLHTLSQSSEDGVMKAEFMLEEISLR